MTDHQDRSTTVVVCANLIIDERGVLLVREAKPTALDRWSLPGGKLESGESLQEGAAREALEETGLRVVAKELLGIYHCPTSLEGGSAINFVFRSTITGGQISTSPEHPEVAFVPRSDVDALLMKNLIRGTHVKLAIEAADAGVNLPLSLVTEVAASPRPFH